MSDIVLDAGHRMSLMGQEEYMLSLNLDKSGRAHLDNVAPFLSLS